MLKKRTIGGIKHLYLVSLYLSKLLLLQTIKRVRETLCPSNGESSHFNGDGPSSAPAKPKPAASDISHLIKRKRKSTEGEAEASPAKRVNT